MSISHNSQNLVLDTQRHSFAHLMAAAVKDMFPETQFGVGPVIENGCYYDFILPRTLIPEDLPLIEAKIKEMLKMHLSYKVQEVSIEDALQLFEKNNQPLKVELLNDLRTRGTTAMSEEERADFNQENENLVYRIISKDEYNEIKNQTKYAPEEIEKDGFIHLSKYDQIVKVANLKMNPDEEHLLLTIDISKLKDNNSLKNEDLYNSGENYPHLYGSLNMDSVIKVSNLDYDKVNKTFVIPQSIPTITIYRIVNESTGEIVFEDLCKGPHVEHVKEMKQLSFALDKFSASYWRGDQERDIRMQRLYALVFETKEELTQFQTQREEAKKRDHRIIGEQMDLFTFSELIGPGLPIWLPKGRAIQMVLEKWAEQTEKEWGYKFVSTPIITKENLFYTSTHLPHYKDSMYSPMDIDGEKYYIKPMNCPFHHQTFAARSHSYKELPLRLSEYGFCHRYEDSGALFGLMRVRAMKMNDAHIYCSREQAVQEFVNVIKLHQYYYDVLGIKDYFMELALRNPENDKYHGDEKMWQDAEEMTKKAMEIAGVPFVVEKDGAAFYGPKVDFQIKSSIGRAFTASTNQIDLFMPTRFGLEFINEKGEKETPVVIHRAPLGTHERFIGFLIEHFGGRFPFWLAPTQVKILTINTQPEILEYVEKVKEILNETVLMKPLKYNEIRFEVDDRSESLGKKIREAEMQKIPVIIIVGPKDITENQVSVRTQDGESKVKLDGLQEFLSNLK